MKIMSQRGSKTLSSNGVQEPFVCRFALARYCADASREEFVNIGVIVQQPERGTLLCRFLDKTAKVKSADPNLNANMLLNYVRSWAKAITENGLFPSEESQALLGGRSRQDPKLLDYLAENFNGQFTFALPRATLTYNVAAEVENLYRDFVEPRYVKSQMVAGITISPRQLRDRLVRCFDRRGLIAPDKLHTNFEVSGTEYPWTFDLGFINGCTEIIQSVALDDANPETNIRRALLVSAMIDDTRTVMGKDVQAFAVVKPGRARVGYDESRRLFDRHNVEVTSVDDMDNLLSTIAGRLGPARA